MWGEAVQCGATQGATDDSGTTAVGDAIWKIPNFPSFPNFPPASSVYRRGASTGIGCQSSLLFELQQKMRPMTISQLAEAMNDSRKKQVPLRHQTRGAVLES